MTKQKNYIFKPFEPNAANDTDAYKVTHPSQYPKDLNKLISYGEARTGGLFPTLSYFGLQGVVHDHILPDMTTEKIDNAEEEAMSCFGFKYFHRDAWEHVRNLGYFPMIIKTLPEGIEVPEGTPLFYSESDDPLFAKIMNSLETMLMHVWYPSTIATNSLYIKRDIRPFLIQTTGADVGLDYMVNDFGLRGATSWQSGARGGAGHLLHARGSDNNTASRYFGHIYGIKGRANSIWATEHSVATSFGPGRGEIDYVLHQLKEAPQEAPVAMVIDSYDAEGFAKNVIGNAEVIEAVKAKTGRTIWRPDSGIPNKMVEMVLGNLEKHFGYTVNQYNYKVINHNTGVIQGDGMKRPSIYDIYNHIVNKLGYSAENLATGSGGGLLQEGMTRDTQRFAIKANYGERSQVPFDIQKKPKSDMSKASKGGKFKIIVENGVYKTVAPNHPGEDQMRTLYDNGSYFPDNGTAILERASKTALKGSEQIIETELDYGKVYKKNTDLYFKELKKKKEIEELRYQIIERYLQTVSFDDLMNRMVEEHGNIYRDKCYLKGYEVLPNNKLQLLLDFVRAKAEKLELGIVDENMFEAELYFFNNYYFQLSQGQGCFWRIFDINKNEFLTV
jgi:nicotinamide phosphoribosyltransferase